jgi:hypothetical protein
MEHIEVSKQDIENYVRMKIYTELTLIREKLMLFEKKYNCNFPDFEKKVTTAEEENFAEWDDYMEWKAFHNKQKRLKEKVS